MIVVDSSALVDVLGAVTGSEALRARLSEEELHAPSLVDYEVVSALRGLVLGGHVEPVRAQDLLVDLDDLSLRRWPSIGPLRQRAFALRHQVSGYDAAYVALAEALECPLVTRDARRGRATGHSAQIEVW